MMRSKAGRFWGAALLAGVVGVAFAAVSPLLISVVIDGTSGNQTLTVSTDRLPKGWFSSKNALDRAKSNLAVVVTGQATACSTQKDGGTLNSTTDGTFTPDLNSQGKVDGYYWAGTKDLSSMQNHWWFHTHCDGTTEKHGCDAAITVSVTATAYDKSGACHTYVNDAGQTVCASDTQVATLPAVQDEDVVDTGCQTEGDACKLDGQVFGACESSCETTASAAEAAADAAYAAARAAEDACPAVKDGGKDCRDAAKEAQRVAQEAGRAARVDHAACECTCKLQQLPVSCPQAQHCGT